jgi:hypothetical protein
MRNSLDEKIAMKLSKDEAAELLEKLKESAPLKECLTCECFQGFIAQLKQDTPFDIGDLCEPIQAAQNKIHKCLGCALCPPADLYAEYLQKRNRSKPDSPNT